MTSSSLWKTCLVSIALALVSCSQTEAPESVASAGVVIQQILNPMETAWASIRANIDKLEADHAHEDDWKRSAAEFRSISSLTALNKDTQGLGISDAERRELAAAFGKSSSVFHFGYECDYHALVFFDNARKACKVIKW